MPETTRNARDVQNAKNLHEGQKTLDYDAEDIANVENTAKVVVGDSLAKSPPVRVLLVDGHGLAFRAFYALPELNAPDGTPTQAILGFANMLLKGIEEWKPGAVALFFDPSGPTRRHELYDQYKAGRAPTPDSFKKQLPLIVELFRALGFPVWIRDGVEADDMIVSSAREFAAQGHEALVLSADKDLLQILAARVSVIRPGRGVSDFKIYDPERFEQEFGFAPALMADYLALVGDKVDNIPGVPGIGEKGATELLKNYGGIDAIYAHLDELPKGVRDKLEKGKRSAYASRGLIVPQTTEPVALEYVNAPRGDLSRAFELLGRLGLRSLATRLSAPGAFFGSMDAAGSSEAPRTALKECAMDELLTCHELALIRMPGEAPLLAARDGSSCRLSSGGEDVTARGLPKWTIDGGQLLLWDYKEWLDFAPVRACEPSAIRDLRLEHYLLHPDIFPKEPTGGANSLSERFERHEATLRNPLWPPLEKLYETIDRPLSPVLRAMQRAGVGVDRQLLTTLIADLDVKIAELESSLEQAAGERINLNSPKQVGELLFEKLGLPVVKKTKTGFSTDVEVLEALSHLPEPLNAVPTLLLDYRELSKLQSGCLHPFLKYAELGNGRVHSTFDHAATGTGRLASSNPNVQNLPVFGHWAGRFRECFVPAEGCCYVAADYSQIELRVLAHASGEPRLLEAFAQKRDIHLETASWIFDARPEEIVPEQRRFAKVVNFGLIYGMSAHGLSARLGVPRPQAASMIERYFAALPGVRGYLEKSVVEAKARGYTVSEFGRIRPLKEVSTVAGRGAGSIDRVAVNSPLQSTAADIAKLALIRMHEALAGTDCRLVLQIHDSLVCEVPTAEAAKIEAELVRVMESIDVLRVPLVAEPKRGSSLAAI